MKISQKMILGFVGVALLIWVVGYLAVNTSQKALKKSIGESSASLAAEILDEIDRNLYNKIERFQSFGDSSLPETIIKSNQQFENLDDIQEYIDEKDKEWTAVPEQTVTPFMKDLINNKLSKELRKRTRFYEEKYGFGIFPEVFVTNKYGANVGQTGKTSDYYQADEEWWQRARRDGLYVRDVAYDESADVYSVDIGIRIDDDDGNFIGAAKVVLNIEEVIRIIKEAYAASEYERVDFKLVTAAGKIIYSTEEYEILEDVSGEEFFERIKDNRQYFTQERDLPHEGEELFAFAHSKGYKDFKGLGWVLLIEHETEEIFAPVAKLRNRIVIISLVVTILAVLLGLFISTSISKPVMKLRDAATEIGKGNLDTQIEVKSNDEIGELAASFNDMAGKLKESYAHLKESHAQLEEKVKERTVKLSSANVELEDEIEQRSAAKKILEERIKELNCLFGLSKLVERSEISLEQIFQKTTDLIRNAYQEPDKTCVRITFEGIQYKTNNFEKSESSQYAQINIHGEKAGDIEVYYLGEKAESGQSPFLKEEQDLLDAVAKHLGNIAERIQAKEKLQLFRNLIDQSNDSVFVIEPKWGRFLDVNDKACDSLGYARKELLSMSVKDIEAVIPDDSAWAEHVRQVRKKRYMVLEGRHKRKDGTALPVEVNVKFIEQEKNSYMLAVVRDITERKLAEEAVREGEERYRGIFESNADVFLVFDMDGNLVDVNQKACDTYGYSYDELTKLSGRDIVEPSHQHLFEAFRETKAGEWFNTESVDVRKDGSLFPIEVHGTRFYYGGTPRLLAIVRDITERKKAEESQVELLEKIEGINKELKDFAYIVSHDLKSPLRGIKTLADWISSDYADKLDEKGKEEINLLGGRVDRMHNLIDGVLEYSRVGREKEKQVQVNLNELVPRIIDAIAPPENIVITVENELPVVECGQTRIMQVFQNLLSNAVKYMDKPKGKIKVGCVEEDGFWKFSVADNGPGIEEKDFERIFQMFQTLVPRDEVEGTGVGLTVVKKIIEMYGGKIWVESKPGRGSTFYFTLPKQKMGVKNAKLKTNIVS